jgi:Fe-S-cluster containining protein
VTDKVRRKVLAVYDAADRAVAEANPHCDASGRCCRFAEYGHTLFISHFEAEILLESAPPFSQPVSHHACPFQVNGLCTAREERPLGCRIYFCDPNYEPLMVQITEACIARLKVIAEKYDEGHWEYAPLHHFLNAAVRPADGPTDSMTPPDSRYPLPVVAAPVKPGVCEAG